MMDKWKQEMEIEHLNVMLRNHGLLVMSCGTIACDEVINSRGRILQYVKDMIEEPVADEER